VQLASQTPCQSPGNLRLCPAERSESRQSQSYQREFACTCLIIHLLLRGE